MKAHDQAIMSCRLSQDGRFIFTASQDTEVKRWSAGDLEQLKTYEGHGEAVWAVAVSPDGSRIVSGDRDGCVKVWDVESGAELASMREHANEVWELAFFPDGSRFVSASWDGTAKVWDLKAAEEDARPPQGAVDSQGTHLWGYIIGCCCSRDGKYVAAGGSDGGLRIWDATTDSASAYPIHRDFI